MKGVIYQWCEVQQKVVPRDEIVIKVPESQHHIIGDEMPATRHPITGDYYTSKAKFREVTRSHGCDEVGTAYENGYDPEREYSREQDQKLRGMIHERFRDIINNGYRRG